MSRDIAQLRVLSATQLDSCPPTTSELYLTTTTTTPPEPEGTQRVQTHAVLLVTLNLTLTSDFSTQNHVTRRISQGHFLYQVWTLWNQAHQSIYQLTGLLVTTSYHTQSWSLHLLDRPSSVVMNTSPVMVLRHDEETTRLDILLVSSLRTSNMTGDTSLSRVYSSVVRCRCYSNTSNMTISISYHCITALPSWAGVPPPSHTQCGWPTVSPRRGVQTMSSAWAETKNQLFRTFMAKIKCVKVRALFAKNMWCFSLFNGRNCRSIDVKKRFSHFFTFFIKKTRV